MKPFNKLKYHRFYLVVLFASSLFDFIPFDLYAIDPVNLKM